MGGKLVFIFISNFPLIFRIPHDNHAANKVLVNSFRSLVIGLLAHHSSSCLFSTSSCHVSPGTDHILRISVSTLSIDILLSEWLSVTIFYLTALHFVHLETLLRPCLPSVWSSASLPAVWLASLSDVAMSTCKPIFVPLSTPPVSSLYQKSISSGEVYPLSASALMVLWLLYTTPLPSGLYTTLKYRLLFHFSSISHTIFNWNALLLSIKTSSTRPRSK